MPFDDSGRRVEERHRLPCVCLRRPSTRTRSRAIALDRTHGPGYNEGPWPLTGTSPSSLSLLGGVAGAIRKTPACAGTTGPTLRLVEQGPGDALGETYKDFEDNFNNPEDGVPPRAGIRKPHRGIWICFPDSADAPGLDPPPRPHADQRADCRRISASLSACSPATGRDGRRRHRRHRGAVPPLYIYNGGGAAGGELPLDHLFLWAYSSDYTRPLACTLWYTR